VATSTAASVATSAAGSAAPPDNGGGGGGGKSGPCACAGLPAAHPIMAWLGMFALAVWRRRRG
jgi:MYXO-CTERM domain-containing protein